ncbi:hypothetical protein R9C00_07915 [Flammeovirgaceae bacterium SG7u.111]|nr:hypothetical protein [Flammeovirgaceae bacterium SG7u.132]WPO37372.1 hypothetical protein R9C00_07915 [Flammeovirgaceae bacterium SG7u.111]
MRILTLLTFFALAYSSTQAQFFVQKLPQSEILNSEKAYVITNAGDTIRGRISGASQSNGQLKAFTLKTDEEKLKFKPMEIRSVAVVPGMGANYEDMALITTIKRASDTTFLKLVETEWVIFERIQLPTKRESYALVQLVNPGFDSKIKVYANPEANETSTLSSESMMLTGGDDTSHFISVNGERPTLIKKGKYKKEGFAQLFGGCDALNDEEPKWKYFAKHIFIYDQKCE